MDRFVVSIHDFVTEKHCSLNDTYEIKQALGEGSYGSVRKITHRKTHEDFAVKIIHKKKIDNLSNMQDILNEVSILRQLDHPNILEVYECYQDKFCYCIVTELCQGGELFDKISNKTRMEESLVADYIRQILCCLRYLHEKHIVHRDLKPENFLLDNKEITANLKLIDFGSATVCEPGQYLTKYIGTVYYIAPEVIEKRYNEKCDVWSAGAILYSMLSGQLPFQGKDDADVLKKVKKGKINLTGGVWNSISQPAKDLVQKLMTVDVNRRPSAREALAHPWLRAAYNHPINREASQALLNNLQSFHPHKKLQKLTLAFIASHLASKNEKEEIMELFKKLDADNSGTLSKSDLITGISQFKCINDVEVEEIINKIDSDGSGEIDFSEFMTASFNQQTLLSLERLELAFKEYDTDNSGVITKENLKEILGKEHHYNDSVWQSMIDEADDDKDGVISLQDFLHMMLDQMSINTI